MRTILGNRRSRNIALQVLFAVAVVGSLTLAVLIGSANLEARGITSGFDFLSRTTGYDVSFALIPYDSYDTFGRLLIVGLLNTIFLGILGILLANIVGLAVATLRISNNATLNLLGTIYVEVFRNVPLILQVLFFYSVFSHLPHPRDAHSLFDAALLSGRGLYIVGLNVSSSSAALALLTLVATLIFLGYVALSPRLRGVPSSANRKIRFGLIFVGAATTTAILVSGRLPDSPLFSMPAIQGLNIQGGIRLPTELMALAVAMAVYGGAYIAEIIRAGFLTVGRGQVEAARALGLSAWHVFSRVRLPLAIRSVLPTLTNQYVWLFKATTLGIAIGFADYFSVVSNAINQAGQTLELIGLLMLGFLLMNNAISFTLNRVNKAIAIKGNQLRS